MASSKDESDSAQQKEVPEDGSWWSSWGKSLVDSVKEKTSSTMVMVQKDLSEFYQTIQADTAVAVVDTAGKVQDKIKSSKDEGEGTKASFKQGISSILSSVSSSLKTLTQDETPDIGDNVESSMASPVYNRREMKIKAIQSDVSTYCNEPEGLQENFTKWLDNFDFDARRSEMSDLLVKNPEIRAIYSRLVPSVVSHSTFWQRYFYKIHQFKEEEERRAALVARADSNNQKEQEYNWDSDDGEECVHEQPESVLNQGHMEKSFEEIEMNKETMTESKSSDAAQPVDSAKCGPEDGEEDRLHAGTEEESANGDVVEKPEEEIEKQSDSIKEIDQPTNQGEITDEYDRENSPTSSPAKEDCSSSGSSVEVIHSTASDLSVSTNQQKGTIDTVASTSRKSPEVNKTSSGYKSKVKLAETTNLLPTCSVHDQSETSSTGSWISVDDEIRVRRSKKEQIADGNSAQVKETEESKRNSGSSHSSAVIVEKDESKQLDDDDDDDVDDFDLDEDINDEELQKIMQKISDKSGNIDDDDDWEDWE